METAVIHSMSNGALYYFDQQGAVQTENIFFHFLFLLLSSLEYV